MTDQKEFLQRLTTALDSVGIPYMLSGSLGSSFHGHPRATNDIDLVIHPTQSQLHTLLQTLGKDGYVSSQTAQDALRLGSMFNVIDHHSGYKADLIIRKNRPFSREEFGRRQQVNIMGLKVWVVSPEDIILSKLEWSKNSDSTIQLQDALEVMIVQADGIDLNYLRKWAKELAIEDLLKELLDKADL